MSLLEQNTKFKIENPKQSQKYVEQQFFKWSNSNFYRTSYHDMRDKSQPSKRNCALPGYKGFVPGVRANSLLGKRFTEQSRDVLNPKHLEGKQQMFSSTGFNGDLIPRSDVTLHATSHKHGKTTLMDTHPNIKPANYFETTSRVSYVQPSVNPKPQFRSRAPNTQFEQTAKLTFEKTSLPANASGYTMNSQLWDGTTWKTEKNLHTDLFRTSYRNNFNQDKPFHKPALRVNDGRMRRREIVFDAEDHHRK